MKITFKNYTNVDLLSYVWNKESEFKKYHARGWFSQYLVFMLNHTAFPEFKDRGFSHSLLKSNSWYEEFNSDIKNFVKNNGFPSAPGQKYGPEKEKFPLLLSEIPKKFILYPFPFNAIQVVPNPWAKPGPGFGILLGDIAYIVYTPNPPRDETWLLVHELLHTIIGSEFNQPEIHKKIQQTQKYYKESIDTKLYDYYPNWEWVVEEYIIHAIEISITGSSKEQKKEWGWKKIDYFIEAWEKRGGNESFYDWLLSLLNTLNDKS